MLESLRPVEVDLKTKRFALRSLDGSHASERYVSWLNDPEVNRFLEVRHKNQTLDDVRRFIAGHDNINRFLVGIFDGDLHVGNFGIQLRRPHALAVLGTMIGDQDYWGQRVVLEARGRILDFLFDELPVEKVSGGCYQTHGTAIFNYKRQGWLVDGVRKADRIDNGTRVDVIHFAMFREDWNARRDG
jgi:ribosomal-protein-alanine N-acetyltransferase